MKEFIKKNLINKVFEVSENIIFDEMTRNSEKKIFIQQGDLFDLIDQMVQGQLLQQVFSLRSLNQNTCEGARMGFL